MQVFADDGERNGGIEREKVAGTATAAATTTIASTTSVPPPTTSTQPQQLPPPPRITFRPLDASTLPELKALNAALFPVNYGPRVYEQALAAGGISHGAFFRAGDGMEEELVGAITVRLESGGGGGAGASLFVSSEEGGGGGNGGDKDPPPPPPPPADDGLAKMYVMTVGVLSAWRGQGIGTALLSNALSMASRDDNLGTAYLHAHSANAAAIAFYEGKFGFNKGKTVKGYYRRLSPPDAVVLWKRLR